MANEDWELLYKNDLIILLLERIKNNTLKIISLK